MYQNLLKQIIIIEDEHMISEMLADHISSKYPGIQVLNFSNGEDALHELNNGASLVILDYYLDSVKAGAMNGLQVLQKIRDRFPQVPVVMHTSQEDADIAANTIKYGAVDYIVKGTHAFSRLDMVMHNIFKSTQVQKNLGTQKIMNWILLIIIVMLVIGFISSKL